MSFIDNDVPLILGAELFRPVPTYISKLITRPRVMYDHTKGPGDSVQLDRPAFWADKELSSANREQSLTKTARERSQTQTIGVGNARGFDKDKVIMTLREYTGPSAIDSPNTPATFQIPIQQLMTAQRKYWDYGAQAFHDSIGSANLLDDYRRWEDRVYINEMLKSTFVYNPGGFADGATVDIGSSTVYGSKVPKITVNFMEEVNTRMSERLVPRFEDGNYWCLCSPRFLQDLRADKDFREITRYPGNIPVSSMGVGAEPMSIPQIGGGGMPVGQSSSTWFAGLAGGQMIDMLGAQTMPSGFVFNGIRYFTTTNMPKATVTVNYSNQPAGVTGGSAARTAELGIVFGPQCIGVGIGGDGPRILMNSNDDFQRFIICIWQIFGSFELIDERFCTIVRSFQN